MIFLSWSKFKHCTTNNNDRDKWVANETGDDANEKTWEYNSF